MRQTNKRFISSLFSLLLIISSFVVLFYLIMPAYDKIDKKRAEKASQEVFLENQKKVVGQVEAMVAAYRGQDNLQSVISAVLPDNPDVAGVIASVQGLIDASKLRSQSYSITVNQPQAQNLALAAENKNSLVKMVGSVTVQFKLTGTYEDFKSFLKDLETNIRIMDLRTLAVSQAVKGQDIYLFDLSVTAYFQANR